MTGLEPTDDPSPPRAFDLERVWHHARERFARFTPLVARLRVRTVELATLQGLAGVEVLGYDDPCSGEPGSASVEASFGDLSHATEVLPRLAAGLRVESPPALVDALRELACALISACDTAVRDGAARGA